MLTAVLCICNNEMARSVRIAYYSVIDSSAVLCRPDRIDCQKIRETDRQVIKITSHPLICVEDTGFGPDDFLTVFWHFTQILGHVSGRYIRYFLRGSHIGQRRLHIRIVQSFYRADRLLGFRLICRCAGNLCSALVV